MGKVVPRENLPDIKLSALVLVYTLGALEPVYAVSSGVLIFTPLVTSIKRKEDIKIADNQSPDLKKQVTHACSIVVLERRCSGVGRHLAVAA